MLSAARHMGTQPIADTTGVWAYSLPPDLAGPVLQDTPAELGPRTAMVPYRLLQGVAGHQEG
eukprot:2241769-Prorocentrum_lima.AAC.1